MRPSGPWCVWGVSVRAFRAVVWTGFSRLVPAAVQNALKTGNRLLKSCRFGETVLNSKHIFRKGERKAMAKIPAECSWEARLCRWEPFLAGALLLLAAAVRLAFLTELPVGLNQDEASAGYEAWALLHSGMDRNGNVWPVLLESWGSGQNILYTLLDIPFVAVLGLNALSLRLPAALAGMAAVVLFWRLARRCRGVGCGLGALLLIAVNPWHIMASRWALESNLLPLCLLAGVYAVVRAREDGRWYFAAGAAFGLSLYAYGTAFFFLPLFLGLYVLLERRRLFRDGRFYAAAALFVLLALPIGLCQLLNLTSGESVRFLGLTLPKLTEARQMSTSVFGTGLRGFFTNIFAFLYVLIFQTDGLSYNALPGSGIFYFFGLPLAAAGLIRSCRQRRSGAGAAEYPLRLALGVSCVCSMLISVNINRVNMVWLPLLYFGAVGLWELLRFLGSRPGAVFLAVVLACFGVFLGQYARTGEAESNVEGLAEALAFAEEAAEGDIYVTSTLNMSYIYVLFYQQIPPGDFAETVVYADPEAAFRQVLSFGRYTFQGSAGESRASCLVLRNVEWGALTPGTYDVAGEFGDFIVCLRMS